MVKVLVRKPLIREAPRVDRAASVDNNFKLKIHLCHLRREVLGDKNTVEISHGMCITIAGWYRALWTIEKLP